MRLPRTTYLQLLVFLLLAGSFTPDQSTPKASFERIYKSAGVLRMIEQATDLNLLNPNGSLYCTISFKKNSANFKNKVFNFNEQGPNAQMLKSTYQFDPLAFYPEYSLAIFEIQKKIGNEIYVFVNSKKTVVKRVHYDPHKVALADWPMHILNKSKADILEIKFDPVKNYLVTEPGSKVRVGRELKSTADISWKALRFNGDWVELQTTEGCNPVPQKMYRGWVRWTDGKKPLLSLFYDC